jgi:hypothetical protein
VGLEPRLEVLLQSGRVHVGGAFVHVHEHGPSPSLGNGLGGGDEGVGDRDHLIPRADAGCDQRKAQGVSAAVDRHTESGLAEPGELLLEGLHLGAADESRGADRIAENGQEFIFESVVLQRQIKEWNLHSHGELPSKCKYQSAKCRYQSAKCRYQSAKCKYQSANIKVQSANCQTNKS